MMGALFSSATGMQAQQLNVDTISNNLANVNTNGFKRSRVNFQDLLYQTIRPAGGEVVAGNRIPIGIEVGMGVKAASVGKLFTQGDFQETSNKFDLVIEGDGFFQVLQADGSTAYTRDGSFTLDSEGRMVTGDGFLVQPEITVPQEAIDVVVGQDGTVDAIMADFSVQNLGQITVASFINPAGLHSQGKNLYASTEASGAAVESIPGVDGAGTLLQGFVERSNVRLVDELVNLIIAQRAYEINSKSIQTADGMLRTATQLK